MSRRQGELDALVATGYKSALTEERRRYCFLVDRQCCVTKLLINYHSKVGSHTWRGAFCTFLNFHSELLSSDVMKWRSETVPVRPFLEVTLRFPPRLAFSSQVRELLSQKLSSWQQSCSQPTKLPERALNLLRHTAPQTSGAAGIAEVLRHTKIGSAQPEQVRGCRLQSFNPLLECIVFKSSSSALLFPRDSLCRKSLLC